MSGGQRPAVIDPEMVFEERNLVRRIQNALGIDKDDISADDTMEAAILYNTARQVELLTDLAGEGLVIENVSPNIDLGGATFDIDADVLRDAVRDAHSSEKIVELFASDVAATERFLSRRIRPQTEHSTYHVTLVGGDGGSFWADVEPDNDPQFNYVVSNDGLTTGINQFQIKVTEEAKYNFYIDGPPNSTLDHFRIQEVYTDMAGLSQGERLV